MPASPDGAVEVPVLLRVPLHARPAAQAVRAAAGYAAAVEIRLGDRAANLRGVLAVLALGAAAGSTVVVRATGADARAAAAAVAAALEQAD